MRNAVKLNGKRRREARKKQSENKSSAFLIPERNARKAVETAEKADKRKGHAIL